LRRWIRLAAAAGLILILVAGAAAGWFVHELDRPHAGWSGARVDIVLAQGMSARAMIDRLGREGVLDRPWVARAYLFLRGGSDGLQAGEYRFDRPIGPRAVLARLRGGDVLLHEFTVPEGLDLDQVVEVVAAAGFADAPSLREASRAADLVADLDPGAEDLEGYLFPDTYRFSRGATAAAIVEEMVRQFRVSTGEGYPERAQAVGLTVRQALTLASLIEEETSVPDERRRISAVFHNRIRRSMLLQCDPTVLYALKRAGSPVEALYTKHLKFDSPYNTYRYPGLPPGPIANPGKASLDAAVDPVESRELYFVALPGRVGHAFSETLEQHNRAVARWRSYVRSSR
jgi:UPF0755 protein